MGKKKDRREEIRDKRHGEEEREGEEEKIHSMALYPIRFCLFFS